MDEIEFRESYGLWWPIVEQSEERLYHFMLDRVTDIDLAVKHCRTKGVCVQAGGFIGMWPVRLAKFFERVYTFEPIPHNFAALRRNVEHLPGVFAFNAALGPTLGEVKLSWKKQGCTQVTADGEVAVRQLTIDSLNLSRCDAIFLDVERYELAALAGAAKTIEKFHPVITVEHKADTDPTILAWMKERRYELREAVHGDWIFSRK